ncbi:hypothetical protein Mapa_009620 [Marchantia paleacea]|nr:hypothetical protein Mapa_009620 [Marchantia paleacea]
MDSHVIKVIYEDATPCRFNYSSNAGGEELSLEDLQTKIRNKLDLPSTGQMKINYKDDLGEFVRMTSDEDLYDALVRQALKPLVLKVKFVEGVSTSEPPPPKSTSKWSWGATTVSKVHPETSASETVSDARCNAKVTERGLPGEYSTSRSVQLADDTPSLCDSESNSGLEEEPGGNAAPAVPQAPNYKCYECEMNPIVGPWYLSMPIRKQPYALLTYHLCENCFVTTRWRLSRTVQFKLIKECVECHQYKPDVRRYPFQGNMSRQASLITSTEENQASEHIYLCDWCFRSITHRVMDIENRSMSQSYVDSGSKRRMLDDCPVPPLEMSDLLPPTSG